MKWRKKRKKRRDKKREQVEKGWTKGGNKVHTGKCWTGEGEITVSLPPKKKTATTETIQKNVFFFWNDRKVCKRRRWRRDRKRIIKSKRIFTKEIHSKRTIEEEKKGKTYIQEREQKWECPKNKQKKKKTFFLVKGIERGQTCKKTNYKFVRMSNKKGKNIFETCRSFRKSFWNEGLKTRLLKKRKKIRWEEDLSKKKTTFVFLGH